MLTGKIVDIQFNLLYINDLEASAASSEHGVGAVTVLGTPTVFHAIYLKSGRLEHAVGRRLRENRRNRVLTG